MACNGRYLLECCYTWNWVFVKEMSLSITSIIAPRFIAWLLLLCELSKLSRASRTNYKALKLSSSQDLEAGSWSIYIAFYEYTLKTHSWVKLRYMGNYTILTFFVHLWTKCECISLDAYSNCLFNCQCFSLCNLTIIYINNNLYIYVF